MSGSPAKSEGPSSSDKARTHLAASACDSVLTAAFRVDASLNIGSGHIMRCLTLADVLKNAGVVCTFICRDHPGNLFELIRDRGHGLLTLPRSIVEIAAANYAERPMSEHESWLGCGWEVDASQTRELLQRAVFDWLVVDHYALDSRWELFLASNCKGIMAIDDLADRPHHCDVLLDQTLGRKTADYGSLLPKNAKVLVGSLYAMLRPEFSALRAESLRRREEPRLDRILISMGGVDKENVAAEVLRALRDCRLPKSCGITVVLGAHAAGIDVVLSEAQSMRCPTDVKANVGDMAELMTASDLAIGASGSTSWERCCLGLPSVTVVLGENQRYAALALQDAGASINIERSTDFRDKLITAIRHFSLDQSRLSTMSKRARLVTDGLGAERVKKMLFSISGVSTTDIR